MIITKIQGGLGNQMFQYAIGRQLAYFNDTELKLDTSFYSQNLKNCTPREYSLSYFNIIGNIATEEDIKKTRINNTHNKSILYRAIRKILKNIEERKPIFKRSYIHEPHFYFCPEILKIESNKNIYLYGNWQTEKYFKDIEHIIKQEFTLKNKPTFESENWIKKIETCDSVSLHIRRRDYVNNPKTNQFHGTCSLEYYKEAIDLIFQKIKSPILFIFSDDINWVKNNIKIKYPLLYVSNNNIPDYEELIIMSKCKHNIIANSSFSWWGAWLNQNPHKIVIAPKKWFSDDSKNTRDLIPNLWIRM